MTLIRLLLVMVAAGLIFSAGVLGTWISDREYPTRVISAFLIDNKVEQGGELQTHRTVDRQKLCHTIIDRYFLDSEGRRWDIGIATYPNGAGKRGVEEFIGVQTVPSDMPPGQSSYYALVCYRCNPIQWIWPVCEPARHTFFEVICKPDFHPEAGKCVPNS